MAGRDGAPLSGATQGVINAMGSYWHVRHSLPPAITRPVTVLRTAIKRTVPTHAEMRNAATLASRRDDGD